jgi:hypothetical protein
MSAFHSRSTLRVKTQRVEGRHSTPSKTPRVKGFKDVGLLPSLYNKLWTTRDKLDCKLRVPHTVVFENDRPAAWFFTSKVDGKLLRKKPESLTLGNIFRVFSRKPEGIHSGRSHPIVAILLHKERSPGGEEVVFTHLTEFGLRSFIDGAQKPNGTILQKFVQPSSGSNGSCLIIV